MERLTVIKVGGAVVENEESLNHLLNQFAAIPGAKVLVHGGGRSATRIASELGIESRMIGGRRVTDAEMLKVVTMVYAGLVNKNLVAGLQARGVNAVGLTGADMNIIRSHKRPLKKVRMDNSSEEMVDFGYVGDVDEADGRALAGLLREGIIPIVAPLTHDGMGSLLNTNADTMASTVARTLSEFYDVTLTYCFEMPGVMRNPDDVTSVIRHIGSKSYEQIKAEGVVSGGMIPKLDNAFEAIEAGVSRVLITHFSDIEGSGGTCIELQDRATQQV